MATTVMIPMEEYLNTMGAIWIVDRRKRALFTADANRTHPVSFLTLAGTDVRLTEVEIFAELDEIARLGQA